MFLIPLLIFVQLHRFSSYKLASLNVRHVNQHSFPCVRNGFLLPERNFRMGWCVGKICSIKELILWAPGWTWPVGSVGCEIISPPSCGVRRASMEWVGRYGQEETPRTSEAYAIGDHDCRCRCVCVRVRVAAIIRILKLLLPRSLRKAQCSSGLCYFVRVLEHGVGFLPFGGRTLLALGHKRPYFLGLGFCVARSASLPAYKLPLVPHNISPRALLLLRCCCWGHFPHVYVVCQNLFCAVPTLTKSFQTTDEFCQLRFSTKRPRPPPYERRVGKRRCYCKLSKRYKRNFFDPSFCIMFIEHELVCACVCSSLGLLWI